MTARCTHHEQCTCMWLVYDTVCILTDILFHDVCLQLIIDPVCMLTCCPQLLRSFVYKVPTWGPSLFTPLGLMDLARFVCSRDLIIAEVSAHASSEQANGRHCIQAMDVITCRPIHF